MAAVAVGAVMVVVKVMVTLTLTIAYVLCGSSAEIRLVRKIGPRQLLDVSRKPDLTTTSASCTGKEDMTVRNAIVTHQRYQNMHDHRSVT